MDINDIQLIEDEGKKRTNEININKVLSTACLMRESLLNKRMNESKSNVLHPSLKLICTEDIDVDEIRKRVEELVSVKRSVDEDRVLHTIAEDDVEEDENNDQEDDVEEEGAIVVEEEDVEGDEVVTRNNNIINKDDDMLRNCIDKLNLLTQTTNELKEKIINNNTLQQYKPMETSTELDTLFAELQREFSTRESNEFQEFSDEMERCMHLRDVSNTVVQHSTSVSLFMKKHDKLIDKWKKRMSKQSALKTV